MMTSYTFFVPICSQYQGLTHSVHCPLSAGGKVEIPTKFSKRRGGGLGRTSTFREGCWERGDDFFHSGDAIFTRKKLKSEIFNNKKSLQAKISFSVITNNSNWGILPKDLVTFKR